MPPYFSSLLKSGPQGRDSTPGLFDIRNEPKNLSPVPLTPTPERGGPKFADDR
jgi:hypothetical protein